jgi:DNA polymerase zeta
MMWLYIHIHIHTSFPSHWQVKGYLVRQWSKILGGRVSLQDFVFAKEVR